MDDACVPTLLGLLAILVLCFLLGAGRSCTLSLSGGPVLTAWGETSPLLRSLAKGCWPELQPLPAAHRTSSVVSLDEDPLSPFPLDSL